MHPRASTTPALRVRGLIEEAIGAHLPLGLRVWDGSVSGPADRPTIVVRNRRALRHVAWSPGELGLARAYVCGDLDVEGDMLVLLRAFLEAEGLRTPALSVRRTWRLARRAAPLGAIGARPARPVEEVRRRRGRLHSKERDAAVISHHYDVGNDFYRLVLGDSMVYSCAYFDKADGASLEHLIESGMELDEADLEHAQSAKLDLVCRKLALRPGMRLLDVGCGWGSMALHAATEHGVDVVGVTLSRAQADLARQRVRAVGMQDRVQIRVQDYRDIDDGPYDAIASIGMAEHVGRGQFLSYAGLLHDLLRPGGRLLNQMIASHEEGRAAHPFIEAYVFPDGELMRVGDIVAAIELAGLEVRDLHVLREHYALTLRHWVSRLERHWDDAVAASSEGRARVWRLYMAASALGFEERRLGVNQVLAIRPTDRGSSGLPLVLPR